uniref:Serpentine receptor class gamma n=1 Tax=Panagrellus redivivus TaxID=6233 RepID=A0A7E4V224_PANRE
MKTTQQRPVVKKTWSDEEAKEHAQLLSIHTHAPWLFSTITAILGFYYTSMENQGLTGIMILPLFIYFNTIHFAKSYLSYNKTMILTLMSLFPTMAIVVNVVPQFNVEIMCNLLNFFQALCLFSGIFVMACVFLRQKELKERLWADKKLKQRTHHEIKFTTWCAACLGTANFAAIFIGYYYLKVFILPVSFAPHNVKRDSPDAASHIFFSIFVSVFGFLALFFGKMAVCHFLKICKLKAAKTVMTNSALNV